MLANAAEIGSAVKNGALVSPSTLYYLALYCLVLAVRFFKVKKNSGAWDYRLMFHVGLEVVYTASGLVVLMLVSLRDYAAFILIVYLILFIFASHIESIEEKFTATTTFHTHLAIIVFVALITVVYFEVIQPNLEGAQRKEVMEKLAREQPNAFRIAIPYEDSTLRAHVGLKNYGKRLLVFTTTIASDSSVRAREVAFKQFWESVKPYKDVDDIRSVIFIIQDQITVEPIRK